MDDRRYKIVAYVIDMNNHTDDHPAIVGEKMQTIVDAGNVDIDDKQTKDKWLIECAETGVAVIGKALNIVLQEHIYSGAHIKCADMSK